MENSEEPVEQENKKTNLVPIVSGAAAVLIILGVVSIIGSSKKSVAQPTNMPSQNNVQAESIQESTSSSTPMGSVREFSVDGRNFAFNPNTITVKKGDTVKITFKDTDGSHNLVINGYNVRSKIIGEGSQDTIQFVADKLGTFEYFCSVGGHREAGMIGTLVVE